MKRLLIAVAAMAGLSVPLTAVATPAHAVDEEMSQYRAGRYYLNQFACRVNDASDDWFRVIDRNGNGTATLKEVRARFPRIKRLTARLSNVEIEGSRALSNPPALWPSYVVAPVDRLAELFVRSSGVERAMSRAHTPRRFMRIWINRLDPLDTKQSNKAATIRARLDLPPPGLGC